VLIHEEKKVRGLAGERLIIYDPFVRQAASRGSKGLEDWETKRGVHVVKSRFHEGGTRGETEWPLEIENQGLTTLRKRETSTEKIREE